MSFKVPQPLRRSRNSETTEFLINQSKKSPLNSPLNKGRTNITHQKYEKNFTITDDEKNRGLNPSKGPANQDLIFKSLDFDSESELTPWSVLFSSNNSPDYTSKLDIVDISEKMSQSNRDINQDESYNNSDKENQSASDTVGNGRNPYQRVRRQSQYIFKWC